MAKIMIVPDSFKGSMTSCEVADIIEAELKAKTDKSIKKIPIADGGEGSIDCLLGILGGKKYEIEVTSPEFKTIKACFGVISNADRKTAVIEFAETSGITKQTTYQTKKTTSFGFGEAIKAALDMGIRDFILCLGGSATTDGACGMAKALGVTFGNVDIPTGEELINIETIDVATIDSRVHESTFTVMCDVENPLYGEDGAAYIYGPQKGATKEDLKLLDDGLKNLCDVYKKTQGIDYSTLKGGGAAGGAGFGCVAFLGATLKSGIDLVLDICNFDEELKDCELVITGEGKLDKQSLMGKVLSGIKRRSKDIPLVSFCGICDMDIEELNKNGVTAYEIGRGIPLDDSLKNGKEYLADKVRNELIINKV